MTGEVKYGLSMLRRRHLLPLLVWSIPEAMPAAVSGLAIAHALDDGFLIGQLQPGLLWLGLLLLAAVAGSAGTGRVYHYLGEIVEPMRDDLVRTVVRSALWRTTHGERDDGAVARLTHQVEIVRDTYGGLVMVTRGFVVTAIGTAVGLALLDPMIVLLVLPPFLVGVGLFVATLGMAARRHWTYVVSDEQMAAVASGVLSGARDIAACGNQEHALQPVNDAIQTQARAERAFIPIGALRTLCLALGGIVPLLALMVAAPQLMASGLGAGAIAGGLTYILTGLQPALRTLISGIGSSGLRFIVTLRRLRADGILEEKPLERNATGDLQLHGVWFSYGNEPVLRDLTLDLRHGDHLAIVGSSGIGKSTLAALLCGLLRPGEGEIRLGGVPAHELGAQARTLIPQEAYVFSGWLWENIAYLRPDVDRRTAEEAVEAIGADRLLRRGWDAYIDPAQLSASERQQIALVRAYLSPAPLVILDEATCHLDANAERQAEEAFAQRDGMLIVIAHRMSSAMRARQVLVLEGSQYVLGTPSDLELSSPMFRELLGYWSDPAGLGGDANGLHATPGPRLEMDAGQVITHSSRTEK